MYYFARNLDIEGWSIDPCQTLKELKEKVKSETFGAEFKLFKELDFEIKDEE